ncbi:hypothetical protein ACT17_05980 [Mycolicibacterium conceptionense]|uniref:Uncharacterized protein n=1 Tax=Mycolicibacterium conceptionense TaxID=451644 RepID=A0A0J8UF97_9MYCO|nr:type I-E CRISPR-associated protein Cse1/CasA [Mycolicibacterium conceptionense]KMV19597.1 hypothetical protein ACT17_05980 [Mycolicibacterium conceptionense]
MPSFSLATEPWIPVVTESGSELVSLSEALRPGVRDIASGRVLDDAAIRSVALAAVIAARRADADPVQWVLQHAEDFDIFHPQRPFWQNPDMAQYIDVEGAVRPLIDQDYAVDLGTGSAAVNMHHTHSGVTYTPAQSARLLVGRMLYSVGGIQQFPSSDSGPYGKGVASAIATVATNRPFVWLDTGDFAESLALNAELTRDHPAGTFHFGWPQTNPTPPVHDATPTGVLDALTWVGRSAFVVPGDPVTGIMLVDGLRWPEVKKSTISGRPYTAEDEGQLIPFTVYARKDGKTSNPLLPQSVHVERPPWRQLLSGLAGEQPEGSVLAAVQAGGLPPGTRIRIAGLASYQARRDGTVTGDLPVPVEDVDPAAVSAVIDSVLGAHGSDLNAIENTCARDENGNATRGESTARRNRLDQFRPLRDELHQLTRRALLGKLTQAEFSAAATAASENATTRSLAALRVTRPLHAARAERNIEYFRHQAREKAQQTKDKEPVA